MKFSAAFLIVPVLLGAGAARADTAAARCDIYPAGSDHATASLPCSFGQSQGNITITREDGVTMDLRPDGDTVGNFRDQHGNRVYRNSGLGDAGVIFRSPTESIFLYWDADVGLADPDGFSIDDYDATATLRCGPVGAEPTHACPAGATRMENRQASVTVRGVDGAQFTLNFMRDATDDSFYVNATSGLAEGRLTDDIWHVVIDGRAAYEVPLALIEGG